MFIRVSLKQLGQMNKATLNPIAAIGFIIAIYFFYAAQYGVNAPWIDDVRDVIEFMILFHDQPTTSLKVKMLSRMHNEHVTTFSHIIYILQYNIFGVLNFKHLPLFSVLAPVGLLLVYATQIPKHRYALPMLLVAALMIFQLNPWYVVFSSMGSLSAYFVVFFSAASLALYFQDGWKTLCMACVFAIFALYTNINGALIVPAMLATQLVFALAGHRLQLKRCLLFVLFLIPTYSNFMYFYSIPSSPPIIESLQFQLSHPLTFIHNLLFLLGSGYCFESITGGMILGIVCLLLIVVAMYSKAFLLSPALTGIAFFLAGSLLLIAIQRGNENPASVSQSHYYHLSMHLWVMLFLMLALRFLSAANRVFPATGTVILLLVFSAYIASYIFYTAKAINECPQRKKEQYNYIYRMANHAWFEGDYWDNLIRSAIQRGYISKAPDLQESRSLWLNDKYSCYVGAAPYPE